MDLSQKGSYIYTWHIEDFKYNVFEYLESPPFIVEEFGNTKWYLFLVDKSDIDGNAITCNLRRSPDDGGPQEIHIRYTINVVGYCILNHAMYKSDGVYEESDVQELSRWKSSKESLNIVCCMWQAETKMRSVQREVMSRVGTAKWESKWIVSLDTANISNTSSELSVEFPSTSSSSSEPPFFTLRFNYKRDKNYPITVQLRDNPKGRLYVRCKISILNRKDKIFSTVHECFMFTLDLKTWTFPLAMHCADVHGACCSYLETVDKLFLSCSLQVADGTMAHEEFNIANFVKGEPCKDCGCPKKEELPSNSNTFHDCILRVGDQTFPVHKKILLAECPTFHDKYIKESKDGMEVDLSGFRVETLKWFLTYIYTESLVGIDWESAARLLAAAEKLEMTTLKSRCASFLKSQITLSTACQTLTVGHHHGESDLKLTAQRFIKDNYADLFSTNVWRKFEKNEEYLATEMVSICMHDALIEEEVIVLRPEKDSKK